MSLLIDDEINPCPLQNTGVLDLVYRAGIGQDAALSWSLPEQMLPTGETDSRRVMGHGAVVNKGFLYILGGILNPIPCDGTLPPASTIFSRELISSPIDPSSGSLGSWSNQPETLPEGVAFYGYAVVPGLPSDTLYVVGGYNGTTTLNKVFYATIAGGNVGPWTEDIGHPLPMGLNKHEVAASSKALYVIGGMTQDPGVTDIIRSEVYYATVSPGGGLSAWTPTTPLPHPLHYHAGAVIFDSAVVVTGGADQVDSIEQGNVTHSVNEVLVAEILEDNSLGPWQAVTPLPEARYRHAVALTANALYVLGGERGQETSNQNNGGAERMNTVFVGRVLRNQ